MESEIQREVQKHRARMETIAQAARQEGRQEALAQMPRNPRKPPLDRLIKQAERVGKTVTSSITTSDGHTLTFGEPGDAAAAANPWDEVLKDAPDKKRPA